MGIEEGFKFKKRFKSSDQNMLSATQEKRPTEIQPSRSQPLEIDCEGAFEIYGLEVQSNTNTAENKVSKEPTTASKPSPSPKLKIPIVNLKEL